jgi:putative toxin-antitoxin system antitoxin component (TIGR02293 family)
MKTTSEFSDFFAFEPEDNYQLVEAAQQGVSANLFFDLAKITQYDITVMENLLNITARTVRTYQKEDRTLSPLKGELLLKLARLFKRGQQVFGSLTAFRAWMEKPAYGLHGALPFSLLNTSEGINIVMDEVERIAYGEFT